MALSPGGLTVHMAATVITTCLTTALAVMLVFCLQKHPIDFLAAARPQARTTTETLRMMGAYSSDKAVAEQLGMYVPNACSSAKLTLQ